MSFVAVLALRSDNCAGEIPKELGSLSTLEVLDLIGNKLTGEG